MHLYSFFLFLKINNTTNLNINNGIYISCKESTMVFISGLQFCKKKKKKKKKVSLYFFKFFYGKEIKVSLNKSKNIQVNLIKIKYN